jgi:anti-sigma B factor antagonist
MDATDATVNVRRVDETTSIIDIQGEVTGFAEDKLMDAYALASQNGVSNIIFNFSQMAYMNSSGIGLLITILIRAKRQGQRLFAVGLNEHFQQIFELTRLREAVPIYSTETEALSALKSQVSG